MTGLSLRQRLLVLVAIALLPAILILTWEELELRRAREAEVRELALRYAQLAGSETNSILAGVETLLLAVGRAPIVRDAGPACTAYLAEVRTAAPALSAVAVLDREGRSRCQAGRDPAPITPAHLAEALRTGHFAIGEYTPGTSAGGPTLPLAAPLAGPGGTAAGVIVAQLDLAWFGARMAERGMADGGALTVADRNGVLIVRHPFPERFVGTRIPAPFQTLLNEPGPGVRDLISQDGTRRVIGYLPVTVPPYGLYVSAGLSHDVAFQAFDSARLIALSVMILCSAVAFALAWAAGQRFIQRPVERLLHSIAAWRGGDMAARTGMTPRQGELGAVGAAFDGLVQELTVRQAARDEWEAHRAMLMDELTHRVKNILSIVQAIAAQTFRSADDPKAARAAFDARIQALSRAHALLIAERWEAADIAEVVQRALDVHDGPARSRITADGPGLRLQSRAALALALALHELATNAVKYGALSVEGGRVAVTWRLTPDGRFKLDWTEHGGPSVREPERGGFGSQLIERALAAELGGTVRLSYPANGVRCEVDAEADTVTA